MVPFEACLATFASPQVVADYQSPALPADAPRTTAQKTQRFKTFPPYLVVHLQRYYVDTATWQGKKMEVSVPMPQELDLTALRCVWRLALAFGRVDLEGSVEGRCRGPSWLRDRLLIVLIDPPHPPKQPPTRSHRGKGQQPGEEALPEEPAAAAATASGPPAVQPDEGMAAQMMDFGFSLNGVKRALVAVQNSSVDAAVSWLFEHSGDADINDPLPDPAAAAAAASKPKAGPSAEEAANLAAMLGFSEQAALAALTATGGDMERAADWLFSRAGDLDAAVAEVLGGGGAGGGGGGAGAAKEVELGDGEGKYELVGFASHIGKNLGSGHYVAHIKKGGRWAMFDDQKVAASQDTPFDLGFIYVYRRKDGMEMD